MSALPGLAVPSSTYRVQFQRGCGFEDVARAVPYLHALGISHLYSSPYLLARSGSTHGYDIVDHARLNPEVGTEEQHRTLCRTLGEHGLGQILDVVPNHMGVLEADNAWWLDVLEHGRASPYADAFDIEWQPADPSMAGRLLLPVLGDHRGRVLEAGEIVLRFDAEAGSLALHYYGHRFPIDPSHYPLILRQAALPEADALTSETAAAMLEAFERLPARDIADVQAQRTRRGDSALLQRRLAEFARETPAAADWIAAALAGLNGTPGDAASFDGLDALLQRQIYRLAHWRVASDDVNYRRFFDVNGLAGLRTERTEVFEATHARALRWLQDGCLDGLRIDHPDGLADPAQYFERLRARHRELREEAGLAPFEPYLAVEKIQAEHEALPEHWPVQGDTGYRFGALVHGVLVDARNEEALDGLWRRFTDERADFDTIVHTCKHLVIERLLASELQWLAEALHRLLGNSRRTCDFTRHRLRAALAEVAACFPVYRTYLRAGEPPSATDRQHVDWATAAARRHLGPAESLVLDALRDVLLGEGEAAVLDETRRARFIARWQQFTAPVMAKAVEDTAFYRYLRLASLNEVGGDPRRFGVSAAAFHGANQARQRFWPHAMLATSTHDSKRSEDLRARLAVLSEMPEAWEESLQRLAGWAQLYEAQTDAGPAPCRRDIWLLFQTLAGLWPAEPPGEQERDALRARLQAYMLKATREAKDRTDWICPDTAYEDALQRYIDAVLRPGQNPFAEELQRLTALTAPPGFRNALVQLALKLTVPGVPDLYQGCERWSFRLVDPDNRAPVDFVELAAGLREVQALYAEGFPHARDWDPLLRHMADGRIKQLATWRLLQLRRRYPELLREGNYLPVEVQGPDCERVLAFVRRQADHAVLVVATRWMASPPTGWNDTALTAGCLQGQWQDWFTGELVSAQSTAEVPRIALSALLRPEGGLPFAVLTSRQD